MTAAEVFGREGVENLWAGRLRLAIQQLQVAGRSPRAAEALVAELRDAQAELDADIAQAPREVAFRVRRGICRLARAVLEGSSAASFSGASSDLTVAVAIRPKDPTIRLHLANALIVSVRFAKAANPMAALDAAISDLDSALLISGASVPLCHSRSIAGLLKARLLRKNGWDPEPCLRSAIADLTRAAELEPGNAEVLKDLGVATMSLAKRNRSRATWSEALSHFDLACGAGGATATVLYKRGQVHFALRQFAEACADFVRCMELNPALERKASRWIERTCTIAR